MIRCVGILVPTISSYIRLLEILYEALGLKPEIYTLQIKYIFELGISPVNIVNDRSFEVYFELKKNEDKIKFPLCIDTIGEPMTILDSDMSLATNNYRVSPHQIRSHHPHIGGYYPEMPTQEELNPDPIEMRGHDFTMSAFFSDCGSGSLEDISQFHARVEEEEINDRVNIGVSRGATSTHIVKSSNRETASEWAINYGTSSVILPSSNELDVLTEVSPKM
ncbi:hypothetical protein TorRG33x02_216010 [Trema orientale]|uniref:Uncharacterized protein n=1 Tax=Trema orientale TaxID=63057 RepID=A0A2P5EAM6_TREOI|nr:hypothetical protein TorRG33x02_216010 [Trema orientale]